MIVFKGSKQVAGCASTASFNSGDHVNIVQDIDSERLLSKRADAVCGLSLLSRH